VNKIGEKNDGVLIQEFLEGNEFVIDSVSRNGTHKTVQFFVDVFFKNHVYS